MIVGIRKALEQRLNTLNPLWSTAWENVGFEPTPNTSHQRVFLLPGSPLSEGIFLGSVIRHTGLMQIDICTIKDGGPNVGDARAVALQTHFKRGTSLACDGASQNLWVPSQPIISPATFEATWRVVFVTIEFNVLAAA